MILNYNNYYRMENIKKIFRIYDQVFSPPEWILELHENELKRFMKTTIVLIHSDKKSISNHTENKKIIDKLITRREPVNIGMERKYDIQKMKKHFGYEYSAYDVNSPNIAIYTNTPIKIPSWNISKNAHIINVIAPALDSYEQPDYIRLSKIDNIKERKKEYEFMFTSCFEKILYCFENPRQK
jgi:hypothetical protein